MALLIAFLDITQGKEKKTLKYAVLLHVIYTTVYSAYHRTFKATEKPFKKKLKTVLEDNTILIK